jgi:hypothetical protein
MKTKFVLLAVCFLLSTAVADTLSVRRPQRSRVGVYVLEGLAGLPGVAGCGCLAMGFGAVAFMAAWGGGSKGTIAGAVSLEVASLALLPAAAAWGTVSVGERLGEHGSIGWAIGGAYAGLAVGAGAIALGAVVANSTHPRVGIATYWPVPFFVLGYLAVPVGAVVGYNLGAPSYSVGGRLQVPSVALTGVELPDHSVEYGVKVQLAGLRF